MPHHRWIDTHIHVSDRNADGSHRERLVEDLLAMIDSTDAALRLVISPDSYWNTVVRDEPDGVLRANAFINSLVQAAPGKLYGSCIVNPNHLEASLRTMDECFEQWGFVQLGEMLQYMFDFEMDSDAAERLVRKAVAYDVPVQVHISTSNAAKQGNTSGRGEMLDLFGIVERVPEAKYILAHFVGTQEDNPPTVDAYLAMIDERYGEWPDNFWAEIRDFSSPGVRSAMARIPVDKLIAGTDWTTRVGPPFLPYGMIFGSKPEDNPYPPCVAEMVRLLSEAGATDGQIAQIGYGNAAALLKV